VYFFVTSKIFLVVVCFLLLLGVKFDLLVRTQGFFGDCLLFCIFVFIIFIKNCFICAIVGLFVLLKLGKKLGLISFFLLVLIQGFYCPD